jgi:hypothetical protein
VTGGVLNACVWSIAILVFVAERSLLLAVVTLILAAILLWPPKPSDWGRELPPSLAMRMFQTADSIPLMRHLPWALLIATLAHSAWVMVIGQHWLAATLLAVAGAILFWRGVPWFRHEPELTILRFMLAVMVISIFAVQLLVRGGSGSSSGAQNGAAQTAPPGDPQHGDAAGGDFAGIILIPDAEKVVTLVPPLPALRPEIFNKPDDHPLTIPFFGVYWFYRPPDSRPPPTSVTLHGKPEDFRFRSVGLAPLNMEAHQNLGKLFGTGCCSAIQVAIHNLEGRSLPAGVELVLANSSLHPEIGGVVAESLGVQVMDGSEHQMLSFKIPPTGLQQFDDLTVRILRGQIIMTSGGPRMHSNASARISVERFVLVPRGR